MPQDLLLDTKRGSTNPNDFPYMIISGKHSGASASELAGTTPPAATANYTAEGAIPNNAPVALRSDGKIEAIGTSAIPNNGAVLGTATEFSTVGFEKYSLCYNSLNSTSIFVGKDQDDVMKSVVITIDPSNNTSSVGTHQTIPGVQDLQQVSVIHDPHTNRVVVTGSVYSGHSYACLGTPNANNTTIDWEDAQGVIANRNSKNRRATTRS